MAEGTPDTHWRVSPLRTNPIIGLDLRAGTLERYIIVLQALFCGLRCAIAVTIRGLAWGRTTCGSFSSTSTVAVGVATCGPTEQHKVLRHDLCDVPLHAFLVVVGARLQAPFYIKLGLCGGVIYGEQKCGTSANTLGRDSLLSIIRSEVELRFLCRHRSQVGSGIEWRASATVSSLPGSSCRRCGSPMWSPSRYASLSIISCRGRRVTSSS